ncbi:MAG: GNAT family N-acetyltransferase [Gemmatimonadales bacterium]|nr:GNAT family N-acetyltransferase [Gemmatimonadales bacterium]NIN10045.1 GNAT family N-acetyltransferase [Gemmatimonadales bacterium]NIQ98698.1 GNAT family N-acetyltransferase [Gemmatimonadales bacterium]NIS63574.1 GNAT family N-acetyltransferase [Gemmatimonadales bacterium]
MPERALALEKRSVTDQDLPVLFQIYADSRAEEMAESGWDATQVEQFLSWQFETQRQAYLQMFPEASFELVLLDGEPVGRLYVDRSEREIHVIDIALLTEYRRRGIGARLFAPLLEESERAGLPITLYVEQNNPILPWYRRMGFQEIDENGPYLHMKRRPTEATTQTQEREDA